MLREFPIHGVHLAMLDQGAGAPLVFVHGFPLDHTMWQAQFAACCAKARVIAPDLCGFGASGHRTAPVAMSDFADDLAALLDALGVDEPVTLCGLSMGGYVAWQFAQRHPRRLARLVICDSRSQADSPEAARGREQMARKALAEGPAAIADAMLDRLVSPHTKAHRPSLADDARAMILRAHPQGIASALRGMAARPDVTAWLPQLRVPTLVVVGSDDTISPPAEMRAMAEQIPGATLVEIEQAGHLSPLEQPERFNAALEAFLR